ncbi:TPA: hypothetical protein N0F65_008957 [Lagenidium giganteum]|uniref:ADF-H domain-containing protein n=1 Tax=Lagenidium giganteum TaxID=4803 RepID=A0AAV2YTD2_9STRA|nr:TPA: hypothetical protein N0F65_008957 [Lagenidium giganteum]
MARAHLLLSKELEQAFANAQTGRHRFVKIHISDEHFLVSAVGVATSDLAADCQQLAAQHLDKDQAAFVLFCLDVNVPALRWILLAFVPEHVNVRDKMLYSSSRESLKKQLGMNYFVGEFHATEVREVTLEAFQNAKKKQSADAPLSDTERLLKESALLERDTNVKSTAMGVIPFEISQNVREKLTLFKNGKFDWIAMKLNTENESVEVLKSLDHVELVDVANAIDHKNPSFVAYRYNGALAPTSLLFIYVCPEDAPVRQKMVYSTCKATILSATSELGIEFDKTVEVNNPPSIVEDIQSELAPSNEDEEVKTREFSRPVAPGRGRGRGRGRGPPPSTF